MRTLTVVLTHLPAEDVDRRIAALRRVAPGSRFVVCHGGREEDAAAVSAAEVAFVGDPSLRGAPRTLQGYVEVFATVHDRWVGRDADVDAVCVVEFDHLVLRATFESELSDVAAATGADFLGKHCTRRDGTNWEHYGRFRRDRALLAQLERVSVREDRSAMFGTLGDGMWLTRDALAAYVAAGPHPPCYGELHVPTVLHHLGFRVVDLDAWSALYDHVRWDPPYGEAEARALARAGAAFVHPVKDLEAFERLLADCAA